LKEVLDLAHVPHPELGAEHPSNAHAIDGRNQWPDIDGFQTTMVAYLRACEELSRRLLSIFTEGLGEPPDLLHRWFGPDHTSFVRLNHYPLDDLLTPDEAASVTALGDQALHHHSDAGALTVLLQDEVGGLEVEHDGAWLPVTPLPGAFVVNTGDMMQVWSNDRYRAALHRVAPRSDRARYSLPYFYNPSYATDYEPLPGSVAPGDRPHYRTINWGDFRQARADGDFADYGAEIQIADYRV
ncbi:MAG: 2OG-Fe(II) oxygenase family protein, partial [Actinomycetota bacterium]